MRAVSRFFALGPPGRRYQWGRSSPYWDGLDSKTGERRQRSKGGFRTQKAAQAHLATVIVQTNEGAYVEPSKQPLARFLTDEWLPAISATVRPLTFQRYQQNVRLYVKGRDIGGVPLRALTAGHLNATYAEMERDGLSIATRRLLHAILRRALRDARSNGGSCRATLRARPTRQRPHGHASKRGALASCASSLPTSGTIVCTRSGAPRRRPG